MAYLLHQSDVVSTVVTGLDGRPSANVKTGPMAQVWHIRNDMSPTEAVKSGADEAICGNCSLRGSTCYVTVFQAPTQVYKGLNQAKPIEMEFLTKRDIRWGAYGDSALSVPVELLHNVNKRARMWTGYTHQWRNCDPDFKKFLMASCDNEADYHDAKEAGWRTFRVKASFQGVESTERYCPASPEGGSRLNCISCGLCNGTSTRSTRDVVINVHGAGAGRWEKQQ